MKRIFDLVFSLIGLLLLGPLFLIVAVLIKREDGGPVFYRGERVGRCGIPFKIFKFRTMLVNADKIGASSTAEDDPRVTRVGKILRKYKLDELPQLINVLKGDMSFVGPRPQVRWAVDLYTDEEKKWLLNLRPGITDYASIKFHNEAQILKGSLNPDRDYMEKIHPEKMRLSIEYAKNVSLKMDFIILIKTLSLFFKREG
jgi:lipopolysaccharide/colanic/teichoic acid biosynthesis glycosyltransferase